ncbi:MAG: CPBP family intramembrane metalloprotease [Chloroflexi bacterium]|nr:CPBP family intramembrane metalloprotease [Chloroflexota bacterium]
MTMEAEIPGHEPPGDLSAGERRSVLIFLFLAEAGVLIIAIAWGIFRKIPWWHYICFKPWTLWGLLIGSAVFLTGILLYNALKNVPFAHVRYIIEGILRPLFKDFSIIGALGVGIISGVCEESFFRGILQPEIGIWYSNLVFALLHTGSRKVWLAGVWAGLVGVLLGYIYAATGSLLLVMIIHAVNNFIAIIYIGRFPPGEQKGDPETVKNSDPR